MANIYHFPTPFGWDMFKLTDLKTQPFWPKRLCVEVTKWWAKTQSLLFRGGSRRSSYPNRVPQQRQPAATAADALGGCDRRRTHGV